MALEPLTFGDRMPFLAGMGLDESFYSLDEQMGRPVVLLLLGDHPPERTLPLLRAFQARQDAFAALNTDVVALVSPLPELAAQYAAQAEPLPAIVFLGTGELFGSCDVAGRGPQIVVLDRAGRVVAHFDACDAQSAVAETLDAATKLAQESARRGSASAPALIVPHVLDRAFCRELIAHFDSGDHRPGVMASSSADAGAYSKLDAAKKHRRDLVLQPGEPPHARVMDVMARRIAPEIKSSFQVDIAHIDRILIARYDDTGGYFRRHRDDRAPQVAFRQFALSLNLNTGEYEGGSLMFPEFSDDQLDPPAGAALVFSASLLHEATAVTRGSRYVLLTFLHSAEAEARRLSRLRVAA